jgi:hypothetical protein
MAAMIASDKIHRDVLFARLLVVVATVALFLVMSLPWYAPEDSALPASGWSLLGKLTGDSIGIYLFAGWFGWLVVLGALLAGLGVMRLRWRWVCGLLATGLTLLTAGLLLVDLRFEKDLDGVPLSGAWAVLPVLLFAAVAWGNLGGPLRELSYETA